MFTIDNMSSTPVYEQIVRQFAGMVLSGEMKPGDALPSVRELAEQLGVNHNTIQKAYKQLDFMGLTATVPGRGSFIGKDAPNHLIAYLNKNALPQFKDMLRGILHAGATKEQALDYVRELLDELDDE